MASNVSRTIWPECGIDISKLETTHIPGSIRERKWGNLILTPPDYQPEIVRDFYAALVPEIFKESGTVFVRGRKVVITAKRIRKHFSTRDFPDTNLMVPHKREKLLSMLDPELASRLRWDQSNESSELLYEELHPEMALWTTFINHNLVPSKETIITREVLQILYHLKCGMPIDVGYLIHKHICDANDSGSNLLPFPSLITDFCCLSNVTISGDFCPPPADIGRAWYNSFAQQQGIPTLPSRKRDRVPITPVQPPGRVPATPVQPPGRVPITPVQPPGRVPARPVQPPGRVPTTPVQPPGRVPTTPFLLPWRVPITPVLPSWASCRDPATPVQPPGRPLTTPWEGRVPTVPVQPQSQVPTMPVQLQHGNTDRPKWVNEITGRLNSLSDMIVGQYNALSRQINNLGVRVASLENAVRDAEFENLDSHRRVRLHPSE